MDKDTKQDGSSALPGGNPPATLLEKLLDIERQLRARVEKALRRRFPAISHEDMEDVWQNTLTQAWQLLIKGKLRKKEQLPEWIWKSAYHLAIDLLRHRETGVFAEEVVAVSPDEVMEADPAAEVADREQRAAVERWLNQR